MNRNKRKPFLSNRQWIVIGVLVISLLLRWILIFRGGQYFNSDETRYLVSLDAARLLWQGALREALRQFTISPEHLGFKVIGVIPALTEHIVGPSLVIPAMFFSLFSVLNLYLIFLLSQRNQSSPNESLYALFFGASCLSLLYYSRHLIPYDMAMSFGLLALYLALTPNQTMQTSLGCGCLSFLCFIAYNGYWPLAGFVMLVNAFGKWENPAQLIRKFLFTALGFLAPLLLLILAVQWSGADMISSYYLFANSITQGDFQEGWSLPFEYFWNTEYTVILILGILSIIGIVSQSKKSRADTRVWLAGFLFIYICLAIPSVILHYFVVYARLARQLIPFLVLLAAQGLAYIAAHAHFARQVTNVILAVVFVQAAWNYIKAFEVHYPRDFAAEVQARFPNFEFSSKRLAYGAPVVCQYNGYAMENTKFYVAPPEKVPQVEGRLLLSAPHPTNYLPYLYEGDTPEDRRAYRALKLEMSFYQLSQEFMSESNPTWVTLKSCLTAGK